MNELEGFHQASSTNQVGRKPRVALVFGGRSSEHAISCVTAGSVLQAIDRTVYDVVPVGITPDGRWVLEADDPQRLEIDGQRLPEVDEKGSSVALIGGADSRELVTYETGEVPSTLGTVDVVFPLLHGPYGEDGTIQGLLEMAGARYVGAGVFASAVAMDKHYAKLVFQASGFPVPPYAVLQPGEWERDSSACQETVTALGYPVFVKPARGGSSIGITKVDTAGELPAAVELAQRYDPKVVVESAVTNAREIECGVLARIDGGRAEASVVAEIGYGGDHQFYDFEAKYLGDDAVDLQVPADLPPGTSEQVRELAVAAFEAISCEGLARVDFFLRDDGTVLLNEINTMPGFTPHSMFPRMWAATGVDYTALIDRLIQVALRRSAGLR